MKLFVKGVLAVFLTVVFWCVTLDGSCVDVSPFQSHFSEPAVDWIPLHQALLETFLEDDDYSLMVLTSSLSEYSTVSPVLILCLPEATSFGLTLLLKTTVHQ